MNQWAQLESDSEELSFASQWRRVSWQAIVFILLMAWLYFSILFHLVLPCRGDPNFSHGFFAPVFSLFVLWLESSLCFMPTRKPSKWGLLIVAFSLRVLVGAVRGAELFLARGSLIFLIAGRVVASFGVNYVPAALFPLSFLLRMIPMPAIVFNSERRRRRGFQF